MDNELDGDYERIPRFCIICKHLERDYNPITKKAPKCRAFDVIPPEIYTGEKDHFTPISGDRGIVFEAADE